MVTVQLTDRNGDRVTAYKDLLTGFVCVEIEEGWSTKKYLLDPKTPKDLKILKSILGEKLEMLI